MDYTVIVGIFLTVIILCLLIFLLIPFEFYLQRKSFISWAENQYIVLINSNSSKASLILTILNNDIKCPDKLSGLLDNEKIIDINSGKEESIDKVFKRPYSMSKYLFLRDESDNYDKKEVKRWVVSNYLHRASDYKTPFFLITSYKGILWEEIKKLTGVPSIKVLNLKKLWWGYYSLKIIVAIVDKYDPNDKEIVGRFSVLVKPSDWLKWKETWMKVKKY